jgi:hypothetical protein
MMPVWADEGTRMRPLNLELGIAGLLCFLAGCSGSTPMSVGAKGGHCTAGGGCDPGLTCISGQCVSPADSAIGPSGGTGGSDGVGDSGGGGSPGFGGQGDSGSSYGLGGAGGSDVVEAGGSAPAGLCNGAPRACALYAGESACVAVGCSWNSVIPACQGNAPPCTALGAYSCTLAGCTWQLGTPPDAAFGGGPGAGGAAGRGDGGGAGGGGAGGVATGGTRAAGGTGGTGGAGASGGAGGAVCSNVVPCGGDVVGTWTVTSSCLRVSGQLDLSMVGLSCASAPVEGSLQVTGTWTARGDGTYQDATTTFGSELITLPPSCLQISGVSVMCERMGSLLQALGYSAVSCSSGTSGACVCASSVAQAGGLGLLSPSAQTSGTYTVSGNLLSTDEPTHHSYCVSGNRMTWTPQGTSPTTTGTIVFQQGGASGSGGSGSGGAGGSGGARSSGGAPGTGGNAGSGGSKAFAIGPCDIYAADGGPCVAAHSTVRRLSSSYVGPLYQVRAGGSKSGTGGTTTDIGFLADGFADGNAQDAACGTDACTISIIYDQSGLGNHLKVAPAGGQKTTPDYEANAKVLPVAIGGRNVYGVHIVPGVGYRNNVVTGTATGDDAETIYMIAGRNFFNAGCCFDYGNVETNSRDNGDGAAETVYFGNCTIWNKGDGDGPWVMADLENGLWAGDFSPYSSNRSVPADWTYVTGMVKGDAAGSNHWTIKEGNAQSGLLLTPFDGKRPGSRWVSMRKEGAIVLGTAGDNSNGAQGNFFEGVMTARYASTAADDAVQANIVAAYGP